MALPLQNVCLDLHANEPEDNIMTEYEKRFTEMGKPSIGWKHT